nr:hypothetical protein CFP56_74213 [Quercus suber]
MHKFKGCYTENNAQVLELLVFPMIGNFGTSLSAKAVALVLEFWLWSPYNKLRQNLYPILQSFLVIDSMVVQPLSEHWITLSTSFSLITMKKRGPACKRSCFIKCPKDGVICCKVMQSLELNVVSNLQFQVQGKFVLAPLRWLLRLPQQRTSSASVVISTLAW